MRGIGRAGREKQRGPRTGSLAAGWRRAVLHHLSDGLLVAVVRCSVVSVSAAFTPGLVPFGPGMVTALWLFLPLLHHLSSFE